MKGKPWKLTEGEIILEIYRRMYKLSEPTADIDKIIKSGEGKKQDWFLQYYLDEEKQQEIIDKVCEENKVKKDIKRKISVSVTLGSSPTTNREVMLKERELHNNKV